MILEAKLETIPYALYNSSCCGIIQNDWNIVQHSFWWCWLTEIMKRGATFGRKSLSYGSKILGHNNLVEHVIHRQLCHREMKSFTKILENN